MQYRQAKLSYCSASRNFLLVLFLFIFVNKSLSKENNSSSNETLESPKVLRVILPGVFDVAYGDYQIRMRAWGVKFPDRGQPGFQEAILFTETELIPKDIEFEVKTKFDQRNLKVVDISHKDEGTNFSRKAISLGVGWHDEKETSRFGPYLMAQLKAKREKAGIWAFDYNFDKSRSILNPPKPFLSNALNNTNRFLPQISYWVTSFGRIHRPGCSFYQRGRGELSSNPTGEDCRICGGKKGKR